MQGFRGRPEGKLADRLKDYLEERGWYVFNMHGNAYQKGIPDKLCCHPIFKLRLIELKLERGSRYTKDQLRVFPVLDRCGIGVWVLTGADEENYGKLFKRPNWAERLTKGELDKIVSMYSWFDVNRAKL